MCRHIGRCYNITSANQIKMSSPFRRMHEWGAACSYLFFLGSEWGKLANIYWTMSSVKMLGYPLSRFTNDAVNLKIWHQIWLWLPLIICVTSDTIADNLFRKTSELKLRRQKISQNSAHIHDMLQYQKVIPKLKDVVWLFLKLLYGVMKLKEMASCNM